MSKWNGRHVRGAAAKITAFALSVALTLLVGIRSDAAGESAQETLARMRALAAKENWQELIDLCEDMDFSVWPNAADAFHIRGRAYLRLEDGPKAVSDLRETVRRSPKSWYAWHSLGDVYRRFMGDSERALDAYKEAAGCEDKRGWMVADATLRAADILLNEVKCAEALEVLQNYSDEELRQMSPYWGAKIVRASGRVYAAQGKEAEAWVMFKRALEIEGKK